MERLIKGVFKGFFSPLNLMSQSQTNNAYVTKSMNGIISYDDGAGGSMEGGVITCNTLATPLLEADGLQAYTAGASCKLYTNTAGGASDIHIGNAGITLFVDSGIASVSPIYCSDLHAPNVYGTTSINTTFLDTPFTSDTPYLWPFVTGAITIGSATSPIIGTRVCTANNHLANKQYVDSTMPTSLLGLTNIWTGTSNTFNNTIIGNTITAINVSATANLYNNLTTGSINIGSGLTTGTLTLGGTAESGDIILRTTGTINLGIGAAVINLATTPLTSSIVSMANSSTISLNMGNTMTTGNINMGGALTTGGITIGNNTMSGVVHIRNAGTMNLGLSSSAINIGNVSTTLILNAPITPAYTYNATTGITPTTGIGYIYSYTPSSSIIISPITSVQTNLMNVAITDIGIYLINVNLRIATTTAIAGTVNLITTNLGYGATGSTTPGITQHKLISNTFTASGAGNELTVTFSAVTAITTVTSPNNFIYVSALSSTIAYLTMQTSSKMTITRIA